VLRQRIGRGAKVVPITGRSPDHSNMSATAERLRDAVRFLRAELAAVDLVQAEHFRTPPLG
jgi:hypothetical protein